MLHENEASPAQFAANLAAIGDAAAQAASDYKAIVCLFMSGGMDYANTLPPYDEQTYAKYQDARRNLAHPREALAGTVLNAPLDGGRQYALAPRMASLVPLFNKGVMAPILNVGTLIEPVTKQQVQRNTARIPPKLFSHNDQQSFWQSSAPEGAVTGWGGRIGDVFQAANGKAALTCINVAGNAVYLTGREAVQYSITPYGPVPLLQNSSSLYGSDASLTALKNLMTGDRTHLFARDHALISKRGLDTYGALAEALAYAPVENYPLLRVWGAYHDQLLMVARMIAIAPRLGQKRQVFMVNAGGFDTHNDLAGQHPQLAAWVADGLRAFYDMTEAMGVADKVTTFTASDFGRTLAINGDGSDHGWGSHHFAVGGAVKGGRFYGKPPELGHDTADDIGQGRLIPTTSVDQYAATLATWFGVSAGDLPTVLPNIGNYASRNLGFMN